MIKAGSSYRLGSDHVISGLPTTTPFYDGPGGATLGGVGSQTTLDYLGIWGGYRAVVINTAKGGADTTVEPTVVAIDWDAGTIRAKTAAELEAQAREFAACPPVADCSAIQAELDVASGKLAACQANLDNSKAAGFEVGRAKGIELLEGMTL
jgi:hypothetical protein